MITPPRREELLSARRWLRPSAVAAALTVALVLAVLPPAAVKVAKVAMRIARRRG
jgi:hypothetical protein